MSAGGGETLEGPRPERGWVAPAVARELPGLDLAWVTCERPAGRSPEHVRERLRTLSDRFFGAHAVQLRERPVPAAYRVFFRQIGLDPDRDRTPIEALALRRLHDGGFRSGGWLEDALTIATVETGVALLALDAGALTGRLGIRAAAPGESLGEGERPLEAGTIVIADERAPVAILFGAVAARCEPGKAASTVAVVALRVAGVPEIAVEEALWIAAAALAPA